MPALRRAVRAVSDPQSPSFGHYVTPERFGDRFGASPAEYEAAMAWATAHHLTVTAHHNRLAVTLSGASRDVEDALHVQMNYRSRPDGTRFYGPDSEPAVDLDVPVSYVGNLDDYEVPRPADKDGTGTNQNYVGSDLRTAYLANYPSANGCSGGSCQTVAITDTANECFLQSDLNSYWTTSNLTSFGSAPTVTTVNLINSVTQPQCQGDAGFLAGQEVSLDIAMVTAMAPNAKIVVFGSFPSAGNNIGTNGLYESLADTTPPIPTITSSYFTAPHAQQEPTFDQMALQGQSFLQASGDYGAFSSTGGPEVLPALLEQAFTLVGGTELVMNNSGALTYVEDKPWYHSGGGILSNTGSTGLPLPWYQRVAVNSAGGGSSLSGTYRNAPDVSAVADNVEIYQNGVKTYLQGTSVAAPIWAGYIANVNARNIANGYPTVGFANPVLYGLASTPDYSTFFNDVVNDNVGNTTVCPDAGPCVQNTYYAATGLDLVTGLGTPGPYLLQYMVGATAWTWTAVSYSGGPSAVTFVTGTPATSSYSAWVIDNASISGSSDHHIWARDNSGNWSEPSPSSAGIQVSASPTGGYLWMLNHNGTVFNSTTGAAWTAVTANATAMQWLAAGPEVGGAPTAWGISKTVYSGSDYTIWNYNVTSLNAWAKASGGAIQIAVAPDTWRPWVLNAEHQVFQGDGYGSTFAVLNDGSDGGTYYGWSGNAKAFGIGPINQAWVINDVSWNGGTSPDHKIFALTEFNSITDTAWSQEPGGALQITVSANGKPWVINSNHTLFYGGPGWPLGGGLEQQGARLPRGGDAGTDASAVESIAPDATMHGGSSAPSEAGHGG